jgi:hypothetical protein
MEENVKKSEREQALDFVIRIAAVNPAVLKQSYTLANATEQLVEAAKKVEGYLKG